MSFAKKLFSPLRNAFCYATHLESAADYDRKADSAAKLIAQSLPAPEGANDGYEARLRAVLMKTRTKHLDTLIEKEITVVLDTRLPMQRLENGDRRVDGIYYAAAKTVAVWDNGRPLSVWSDTPAVYAPGILEKLAQRLTEGPVGDMYASRYTYTAPAVGFGMGAVACATYTDWTNASHFEPGALKKNPSLREPLKKPTP